MVFLLRPKMVFHVRHNVFGVSILPLIFPILLPFYHFLAYAISNATLFSDAIHLDYIMLHECILHENIPMVKI